MKPPKPRAVVSGLSAPAPDAAAVAEFMRTGALPPGAQHTPAAQPGDASPASVEHPAGAHHAPVAHPAGVRETPGTHLAGVSHTPETLGTAAPVVLRAKRAAPGTAATIVRRRGEPVRRTNVNLRESTFTALRGYCEAKGLELSETIDAFVAEGLRRRAGQARGPRG